MPTILRTNPAPALPSSPRKGESARAFPAEQLAPSIKWPRRSLNPHRSLRHPFLHTGFIRIFKRIKSEQAARIHTFPSRASEGSDARGSTCTALRLGSAVLYASPDIEKSPLTPRTQLLKQYSRRLSVITVTAAVSFRYRSILPNKQDSQEQEQSKIFAGFCRTALRAVSLEAQLLVYSCNLRLRQPGSSRTRAASATALCQIRPEFVQSRTDQAINQAIDQTANRASIKPSIKLPNRAAR